MLLSAEAPERKLSVGGGGSNACQVMRRGSETPRIPRDWGYDVHPAKGTQRNSAFRTLNNSPLI